MDEMISRQAVLKLLSTMPPEEAMTKAMLIQSVKQMDAAQPDGPDNLVKDSQGLAKELVNDCISRQAALDALEWKWAGKAAFDAIKALPSAQPKSYREGYQAGFKDAQPEIIRCRECRYKYGSDCDNFAGVWVKDDDFCSRAERREVSE